MRFSIARMLIFTAMLAVIIVVFKWRYDRIMDDPMHMKYMTQEGRIGLAALETVGAFMITGAAGVGCVGLYFAAGIVAGEYNVRSKRKDNR